eukprot:980914_1
MSILTTLSTIIAIISIILGYIINYSSFRGELGKRIVTRTFDERFKHNNLQFCMIYEDGSLNKFGDSSKLSCDATIKINNEDKFFSTLLTGFPGVVIGETYVDKYWDVVDDNDLGDILTMISLSSYNINPMKNKLHLHIIKYIFNLLSINKWNDWYERSTGTMKTKKE